MEFYQIDPIEDPRWTRLLERHPRASVFHSVSWLQALHHTYGYKPLAFTISPPGQELDSALLCCEVNSWLTGRRLVSLPFSDHCDPLFDSMQNLLGLIRTLQTRLQTCRWKYIEMRPVDLQVGDLTSQAGFFPTAKYFLHALDLHGSLSEIFKGLDKDSIQRRIQHADRTGLEERRGNSRELLNDFYGLFVVTRGRHRLPPMPYAWFQNLVRCMQNALEIRIAYRGGKPVAAVLLLRFRNILLYKYGCSDVHFKRLGATPWLLWRAVSDAKACGADKFDLGRTEDDNPGLLIFKNHWVSQPQEMFYWRFPGHSHLGSAKKRKLEIAKNLFSLMPGALLKLSGKLIYRHIG